MTRLCCICTVHMQNSLVILDIAYKVHILYCIVSIVNCMAFNVYYTVLLLQISFNGFKTKVQCETIFETGVLGCTRRGRHCRLQTLHQLAQSNCENFFWLFIELPWATQGLLKSFIYCIVNHFQWIPCCCRPPPPDLT